ncbi:MAG: O-antigen ligase family protein [Chthonomonadales bacterium]|nr:O-antigen ligase family protein [Chthonomonadales bacterium]
MKRPRVTDRSAERRLSRARVFAAAGGALAIPALLLVGIRGGMLADRPPLSESTTVLELIAVPLAGVLVGVGLLLNALAVRPEREAHAPETRATALLCAAFIVWSALRTAGAPYLHAGLVVLAVMTTAAGVGILIASAWRSPKTLAAVVAALVAVGGILAIMGLREYLTEWRNGNPGWRVFAGYSVPNFLAGVMVSILPLTAMLFVSVRDRLSVLGIGLLLAIQSLTLLLTQSRLGVAALVFGGIVLAAGAWRAADNHRPGSILTTSGGRRAALMIALVLICGLIGAGPVVGRLRASRDQSYSARFRVLTWKGAARMALAHPWTGTGSGSFDVAYPKYAVVGYTQHAHNGYLQIAAETGAPGLLLLLTIVVGAVSAGIRALRTPRREDWPLGDERLIVAGLLSGFAAALAHNAFDSDLYVPGNLVVLSAIMGLLIAVRQRSLRDVPLPKDHRDGRRSALAGRGAVGICGLALIVGCGGLLAARSWSAIGLGALRDRDALRALDAFRLASSIDPYDPEPHLLAAQIHDSLSDPTAALTDLRNGVRAAPIGKTRYRLGKYLAARGDTEEAVRALEQAREFDPHNLRTLLALASVYRSAGRTRDANGIYREMVQLHHSPVGRVRAMPEVVDWEYGIAYAALAEDALKSDTPDAALPLLRNASAILGELWRTRDDLLVRLRVSSESMREASSRYEWVLEQEANLLRATGRTSRADAVAATLRRFRTEQSDRTARDEQLSD